MENKTATKNQYIDTVKIESLRKSRGYSVSYVNKTVLGYSGRNQWSRKMRGEVAFLIEDLVLLANLFNVRVDDLLIKGGRL